MGTAIEIFQRTNVGGLLRGDGVVGGTAMVVVLVVPCRWHLDAAVVLFACWFRFGFGQCRRICLRVGREVRVKGVALALVAIAFGSVIQEVGLILNRLHVGFEKGVEHFFYFLTRLSEVVQ